jgi:predicted metal-dependent enzyme (double-stranded beta helix superfamily)
MSRRQMLLTAMAASTQLIFSPKSNAEAKPMRNAENGKMNIDHFVEDCIAANRETDAQAAVKEVLARAVSNPRAVLASIGEPEKAGINVLHASATLTIFSATWTPQMNLMPHNHLMWANIGIYTGREDNIMWRRNAENIEAFEAAALFEGDTAALPVDAKRWEKSLLTER